MRSLALTLLCSIASEKCESDSREIFFLWFMAFLSGSHTAIISIEKNTSLLALAAS